MTKKRVLLVFVILISTFLVYNVSGACITLLNCNIEIEPFNPNIKINEFSGHCGGIIPDIENNGESEVVLNKFYFDGREYFLEKSDYNKLYYLIYLTPQQVNEDSYKKEIINNSIITIPPQSKAEIWFPRDITFELLNVSRDTGNFVLEGPEIRISGKIMRGMNEFTCKDALVRGYVSNLFYLIVFVIIVFSGYLFTRFRRKRHK